MSMFASDIGIDLGTASVLIYVKGKGVVLEEPSIVAIDTETKNVLAVGNEAQRMIGRTPGNITILRPLKDGVISYCDYTEEMLKRFLRSVMKHSIFKPRVLVCVPSGITDVEERAIIDAACNAGASKAYIIEEPVAAAIGAGIDISLPHGNMIVDIGGGTTDIAVISMNDIAVSTSIKIAGNKFDDVLIKYVRNKHRILIGDATAERVKREIGSVLMDEGAEDKSVEVKGRCLMTGLPKTITLKTSETVEAFTEGANQIVDAIKSVLERTPPELVGDIYKDGVTMTGGGALLRGLDVLISRSTGIPVHIAEDAVRCVVYGTGKELDTLSYRQDGILNIARQSR